MSAERWLFLGKNSGAYASFEEGIKGSLTPGKLADIVILDGAFFQIPEGSQN